MLTIFSSQGVSAIGASALEETVDVVEWVTEEDQEDEGIEPP